MEILVLIPARGGSKGIKNKNLVKIGNHKLIDFSLNLTKKLKGNIFTFVSTDSKKIAHHCNVRGFKNNYIRPAYLAKDKSTVIDATFHALKWLEQKKNYIPGAVLLLQPTSPLRNDKEINIAIKQFIVKKQSSLVGVIKMKEHPNECISTSGKNWKYIAYSKDKNVMRQEYEDKYFFIDGSFYLAKTSFLKKYKSFVVENKSSLYKFSGRYSIDIDDIEDLRIARALISNNIR